MKDEYSTRNLVSNNKKIYKSKFEDPELKNAWGLQISEDSIWLSANKSYKIIQYALNGQKINSFKVPNSESPTGLVLNTNKRGLGSDILYFVTEQGKLYALNTSLRIPFRLLSDNSTKKAMYTGLTIYDNLLYATDFHNKTIDVFDSLQNFEMVNLTFIDQDKSNPLPHSYSPINIINFRNNLFVVYSEKNPASNHSVTGKGKGYIDIYTLAGNFVKRLISRGKLNAPYGLTFKISKNKLSVLVGNYGDGKINQFAANGKFIKTLRNSCHKKIKINGLSSLISYNNIIYYDAGPNGEDGILGTLFKN